MSTSARAAKPSSGTSTRASRGRGPAKKPRINPMLLDMRRASRCHAVSKRSGLQCRAPAVRGHSVCRMHGAAGGAPKGNRNALKRGEFTAESIDVKKEVQALARFARETLAAME